jgi:uncharacterized RDD family membrane protein YckC
MVPEGETECSFCKRDVSRVINRPQQVHAHRHPLHAEDKVREPRKHPIGYTGFWKRSLAGLIDLGFAAILVYGVQTACELLQFPTFITAAMIISGLFYFLVLTPLMISSGYRASPGKIIAGIVVTDLNGRNLSFSRAVFRELAKYPCILTAGIGFILIGFTEKKQGLHDFLALTVVTPRSEAYLLTNLVPANTITSSRRLLFGKAILGGVILFSVMVVCYFGFVLNESVTPYGFAAHSLVLAADSVAETNYPVYSLPLYDTAMGLQPEDTEILVKKVYVLREEGRVNEAETCLSRAMTANPDDTALIIASGDLMYGDAQYQSAIRYYEKALGYNRKDADVWIRKGDAYLAQSLIEMKGMREQYRSLTSTKPGQYQSSDAPSMDAFRSTESYREAIKAYNEAIRIDPLTSVEISGRVLSSTQTLVGTYQGILDDMGIDNSTVNKGADQKQAH